MGVYENGELAYIGHTGGRFTQEELKSIKGKLDELIQKNCPFKKIPKTNKKVTWVKPELVCQVKFQEWTKDGYMRQPIFLGLREDKNPAYVKKERI